MTGHPRGPRGTRLVAPAKLTVSLRVLGRRDDGYHELRAEMVSVDLADELWIDAEGDGLVVTAEPGTRAQGLATGDANLVRRALAAAGRTAGVHLVKRIPIGGGLGGGSADAGAVLRWAGCTDPAVAAMVGADVPFCVEGGRAVVEGIGERVTPLDHEDRGFLLAVPPFGVDTAACYRVWDELVARGGDWRDPDGRNDLTAAALEVEPRLATWRDALAAATGSRPVLAGSGSTWFVEWAPPAGGAGPEVLVAGHEQGRLVAVRTVPARWEGAATCPPGAASASP